MDMLIGRAVRKDFGRAVAATGAELVPVTGGIEMVGEACSDVAGGAVGGPGKTPARVGIICGTAKAKLAQRSSVRDRRAM